MKFIITSKVMKFLSLISALFLSAASLVSGQQVIMNGVSTDGYIGVYETSDAFYWWLCIEPEGTPGAGPGSSFFADRLDLAAGGWTSQNTERAADFLAISAGIVQKQVGVINYVLDNFLPLATLQSPETLPAGAEIRTNFGNNDAFYNSLYAVQQFIAEVYGKQTHTDFTNLVDFTDRWSGDLSEAGIARSAYFQSILAEVASLDNGNDPTNFFSNYTPENEYFVASTLYPLGNNVDPTDPAFNWQDALIIVAPVPEPSGALLIGCCGLALLMRRWRRAV